MRSTGDPTLDTALASFVRAIEPTDEDVDFLHAITLAHVYPEETVCWVVVKGINFPLPISRREQPPKPGATPEPIRIHIRGTDLYLQYAAEVDADATPGAYLHYADVSGGRVVPLKDTVYYDDWRRLPFAREYTHPDSRFIVCRAFHSEAEARTALLETSR